MRKLVSAVVCVAMLVAAAGCGSSSDSSSTSAQATPTAANPLPTSTTTAGSAAAAHKAFLRKVDPICEDYNRDAKAIQKQLLAAEKEAGRAVGNVDTYEAPLKRATASAQRASKRFADQKPPASDAAQAAVVGRALTALAKGNALLLDAARSDDPQAFAVATQALQQVTPQIQGLMRSFGMTVCGARS